MKTKINIGCGKTNFGPEWDHIDCQKFDHVVSDNIFLLNYGDETLDIVYASHFFEYFDFGVAVTLLRQWYIKLKYGGIVRLAVPDFAVMARLYVEGKFSLENFIGPLYGRMTSNNFVIHHKRVYDEKSLNALLERCNFKNVHRWDWRTTEHVAIDDCSRAYLPKMQFETGTLISLNIEGVK